MPGKKDSQKDQANKLAGVFGVGKEAAPVQIKVEEKNDTKRDDEKYFISLDATGYKDYLKRMAGAKGITVTAFLRQMIDDHMKANQEQYNMIKNI